MAIIEFTKMHGLGNDYIYVYTPDNPIANPAEASAKWSRPHFAIGSDGLILIGKGGLQSTPSALSALETTDFSMRIFNNDGSEAMMCGNGIRCVAKFVYDKGLTDKTEISIDTLSGIKIIQLRIADGKCTGATVDMGEPAVRTRDGIVGDGTLMEQQFDTKTENALPLKGTFVSMGNPHYVVFLDHIPTDEEVTRLGREMEFAEAFPQRCNIEFACPQSDGMIRMRVWERGSGITQACGTGACATAVAACVTGRAGRESTIVMDGGELNIEWREADGHVYMTGSAETSFEGTIQL